MKARARTWVVRAGSAVAARWVGVIGFSQTPFIRLRPNAPLSWIVTSPVSMSDLRPSPFGVSAHGR